MQNPHDEIALTIHIPAGHPRLGAFLDALRGTTVQPVVGPAVIYSPEPPAQEAEKAPRKQRRHKVDRKPKKTEKAPEKPAAAASDAKPGPTLDELRELVRRASASVGQETVRAALTKRGAGKLSDLSPDDALTFAVELRQLCEVTS